LRFPQPDITKSDTEEDPGVIYNKLGRTDLNVSALCLGSMTWGTQNTPAEGHAQIDMALDHGVNFIDTAEMYPTTPMSKETQGDSERVIGEWVAASGRRSDVIIATKVTGEGNMNVRNGAPISPATIGVALDSSLTSLKTDYIDLYQLHWPNRGSYMFRKNWRYDPTTQDRSAILDDMNEILECLEGYRREGKIRHVGLSNETAWGTAQWLRISEDRNLPRMASTQNEYSLLCRLFDTDLAELSHNEDVGLLSYSPLACGLLTGKYSAGGTAPQGSRKSLNENLNGRVTPRLWPALDAYQAIANQHGMDLGQMALAWCMRRPFMASVIFGATSLSQLANSLKAAELGLTDEIMAQIDDTHKSHPMPF
jgi:aryl-alcohol dehydrogenase-like predicted oxidoreductase